ncbi:MAG: HAMP domain-containing histidine kinase [Chloroflexi bacterium]|nr:HAMP domain-containing histidine kinase [Chloroflexota bacterium]
MLNLISDAQQHLNVNFEEVAFERGDILFCEGDSGDTCYLIRSGRVAVVVGDLEAPTALFYRGAGDVVGEMALLEDKPRSATVTAVSDVRTLRIDQDTFEQIISNDSKMSRSLLKNMSRRLRSVHDVITDHAKKGRQLSAKLSQLEEKAELMEELQRVRQETSDLIIHDLRNPLANLFGTLKMLEIVLPADIKSQNQDLLEIASLAYTRMKRLVDSLLDMRGIETGERELQKTASNLGYLIEETVSLSQFIIDKRAIQVVMDFPERIPVIFIDEDLIRRVLANLVDNAMKYLPESGVLTVAIESVDEFLRVSIIDNGPGISADQREQIFKPFTQIKHEGITRQGYGLGLRFVKQAIDAHNGRVWVEPGKNDVGSCFSFELLL